MKNSPETSRFGSVMASLECEGFLFYSDFDSGNLSRVECVPKYASGKEKSPLSSPASPQTSLLSAVTPVTKNGKEVPEVPDVEFNIWTKPDCQGTIFENGNRTWFYFGVKGRLLVVVRMFVDVRFFLAGLPHALVKLNMVDLNRQAKMYSQGMAPVYRVVPGRTSWERIRDRPTYNVNIISLFLNGTYYIILYGGVSLKELNTS